MRKCLAGLMVLFFCAPLAWAGSGRGTQQREGTPPFGGLTALSKAEGQRVPTSAAAQLRHEYYLQDFSRVAADGKPLLKKYPKDLELRAWYAVGEFRTIEAPDLPALADAMKKSAPASPWTLLATAVSGGVTAEFDPRLDQCEKAIAAAKGNTDVLVLATDVVRMGALYANLFHHTPTAGPLKDFLAKHKGAYKRTPAGLAAEAQALDTLAGIQKDAKSTAAVKLAERVLKSDPGNVTALLLKSRALLKNRDYQANYDLLKAGAQAVPDSYVLHVAYWKAVLTRPNGKPAAQRQEILADAARILAVAKPCAQTIEMDVDGEQQIASQSLQTALGDLFAEKYPNSDVSDAALLERAFQYDFATETQRELLIAALESFLDRPKHYDPDLVNTANNELVYALTKEKNPDLDRLYKSELAMAGSTEGPNTSGIVMLADRKSHLPEIEALARKQLDAQWTKLQENLKSASADQVKSQVTEFLQYNARDWLDALGWVEFQEGKIDAAFPDLEEASKLNAQNQQAAVHLGRVYEAKGENAKAEKLFRDAFAMPYYGEGDDPAIAALRGLYIHTHGGDTGLEAYMQPIVTKDEARREKVVLATRLKPEKPIKTFELAALDGKQVGSEGLRGKYLVLNFWATW